MGYALNAELTSQLTELKRKRKIFNLNWTMLKENRKNIIIHQPIDAELKEEIKLFLLNGLNKKIKVSYRRKKDMKHTLCGVLLKIRKSSIKMIINNELIISIGFRKLTEIEKL